MQTSPPGAGRRRSFVQVLGRRRLAILAVMLVVVGCAGLAAFAFRSVPPQIRVAGLENGGVLNGAETKNGRLELVAQGGTSLDGLTVSLDGEPAKTRRDGDRLLVETPGLDDGAHELTVAADGNLGLTQTTRRSFTVDTTAPRLTIEKAQAESLRAPATIRGHVEGARTVTVGGAEVKVGDDGAFSHRLAEPAPEVEVRAVDEGGNETAENATVLVPYPDTRAVHITAIGWTSKALRDPILKMAEEGRINAVQLDIKDEDGEIGYDSQVPLARKIGAAKGYYDAKKALRELHERDVRVVGRIVAFRDPILARASWKSGARERVVQDANGAPYGGGGHYGKLSFTNFANEEVREYNMDLAVEAAELGFDDILYDYVRRPDGRMSSFTFPGLGDRKPTERIASFMAETRERVRPEGAFLGACVFGVAATRPTEIAQDIPAMAEHSDYIAPMVYPSHWAAGEYGVSNPNADPYKIVKRSLADFEKQAKGSGAVIVPWLQDFSLGVAYGDDEVAAQVKAARDNGMDSFILWNAGARYHAGGLTPRR
ncbi:putative glycoside hydrolase [Streptomyces sp. DSM 42041]|uniref:Glycoside hydrolase n=1 Tax=Streptomyces hazeniae TaxID=3075538 RepID=A0ABU2NZM0_9ACTN|nr:putative glycoside hydrolase [Streptomyces sp. DSM 42041]MDT0381982.1 putative glycoside hydrolase [Streptomyces sp. DSM 42041]